MATVTLPKTMTVEEFLALPDDGVDRELIYGEVREKGMTVRNETHSEVMASMSFWLFSWSRSRRDYRILCGEAGFILDPVDRLVVGVDVAVNIRKADHPAHSTDSTLVSGPPHVAIEILSPSDSQKEIHGKVRLYLDHAVAAVWIVDPEDRSVRVYRRNESVQFFTGDQMLTCEPELPEFSVRVNDLFC